MPGLDAVGVYTKFFTPSGNRKASLRRLCQHILPSGFIRIRYYGILSSTRKEDFRQLQISMGGPASMVNEKKNRKPLKEICRSHFSCDPDLCQHCKAGM